jgi:prolyl-tRNA editing enzyme YbaK/EbsC (Cys-tRNA(Pro) deacylase)
MKTEQPKKQSSTERVRAAADALDLDITIEVMPASTRTAQDAAKACGCDVSQIVKSLIFERHDDHSLVLLLIAGNNRADLKLAARVIGSRLDQADANLVRTETGFAIGGVAPIGHLCELPVYMDPDLMAHDIVWAAAGAPNAVFAVDPTRLLDATGAALLSE